MCALEKDSQSVFGMPDFSKMNDSQRQAVTHGEGPLLLVAGPGSGKTFTITNRILTLLRQGVPPEKILVITFTREAAQSMQSRFLELCGRVNYPVNFGTFHSVFYNILRESNALKSTKLLTNSKKKALLIPILKQYEESRESSQLLSEDALKILSAISYYKNTMKMTESVNKAPMQWQSHFETIYRAYEDEVRRLGQIDFDDMLFLCGKLLRENLFVREYWQNRFQHILIDEFQDTNPMQYETLRWLVASPYNIFAVGDDDQSIYGFRGAEPECMRKFVEDYGARRLLLDINYRSCCEIVDASLAVVGENKNRFKKQLNGIEARNGIGNTPVKIQGFMDASAQNEYLIKRLREESAKGEQCAVLFRTNQIMQSFAVALSRAELPYRMKEKTGNLYEHFIVKDIMAYLRLARGLGNRADFLEVMNKPARYIRRDMLSGTDGINNVGEIIRRIVENYGESSVSEWEIQKVEEKLSAFNKHMLMLEKLSLFPAVGYIFKAIGYEEYLKEQAEGREERKGEWMELIEWLKEDAKQYDDLSEWLKFQEGFQEESHGQKNESIGKMSAKGYGGIVSADEEAKTGTVQLLTVHASKGLEFDRVWIPDCNERVFPYGRMPDERTVEEERRIFYVAMTRAKKGLELLYLTGTKERPRQPSAFLNPLYSSTSSSNSQLSRYSSNASATFSYSSSSAI